MIIKQISPALYSVTINADPIPTSNVFSDGLTYELADCVYFDRTYTAAYNNYTLSTSNLNLEIENLTPEVFTLSGFNATRVNSGVGVIQIDEGFYKVTKNLDFRAMSGADVVSAKFAGYAPDTLGEYTLNCILSKITTGEDVSYYNGNTFAECTANGGIQRNANCWGADYDLSGVAVSHIYNGFWGGGTMITPRHALVTNHYEPRNRVGETIKFCTPDNQVISRTIISQTTGSAVRNPNGAGNIVIPVGDSCVLLLNEDVPSNIKKYKIRGDWTSSMQLKRVTQTHLAEYDTQQSFAIISTNQNRKLVIGMTHEISIESVNGKTVNAYYPLDSESISIGNGISYIKNERLTNLNANQLWPNEYDYLAPYYANVIVGDSGSPCFIPTQDNDLILFGLYTYPDRGASFNESQLNAMIFDTDHNANVSTGYTVTVAEDPRSVSI